MEVGGRRGELPAILESFHLFAPFVYGKASLLLMPMDLLPQSKASTHHLHLHIYSLQLYVLGFTVKRVSDVFIYAALLCDTEYICVRQ
jgi:hypothetical protein